MTATGRIETEGQRDLRAVVERGERAGWWRREGTKERGFRYRDAEGHRIKAKQQLERIRALALPPAWTEVRIAPSPRKKLQAVGVDTCGRLQYHYQAQFAARQAAKKYAKIERFGEALPALRRRINTHLALEGLPRERVLAVILRLINALYFRVGSERSVTRYKTYGVTTLRNRHLKICPDGQFCFDFVGKHHIRQRRAHLDAELAALLLQIKAIPGPRLFNYLDANGKPHPILPGEVNRYIKEAAGPEFSVKDFRTWGGTLQAAIALAEMGKPRNEKEAKRNIVQAIKSVAERLGNTPAVCRSCYIHPVVFERYQAGITLADFRSHARRAIRQSQPDYTPEELALLQLFHNGGQGQYRSTKA